MSGEGRNGGNLHPVQPGERWRVQTLRVPYMFPVLEADGEVFNPPKQAFMSLDLNHLTDGIPRDDCCYMDVEILGVTNEVVKCKTVDENLGSYCIFEVLNDDTVVRFYNKMLE